MHLFNRLGNEHSGVVGSGIGLVMCKRLLELMDGELGVESAPGIGSDFWFELPLAFCEADDFLFVESRPAELLPEQGLKIDIQQRILTARVPNDL